MQRRRLSFPVVEWVDKDVALGNEAPMALQHLYRAMDVLLTNDESVRKEVFFSTATLLNLQAHDKNG